MENERHSVTGADQTRQGTHVPVDHLSLSHLRIEKTRDGIVLVVIDSPGTRVNKVSSALLG
ncbi:MAG TPA: hypothetical protein P5346_17330, partial [Spirochaetota bacterium]|nr:hypothetical protein [Spirochaetota bacterium]